MEEGGGSSSKTESVVPIFGSVALGFCDDFVMCGYQKTENRLKSGSSEVFSWPLTEIEVLIKCARCVSMMLIERTWLEVSILPVEREKTPRHRFSTFIVLRTVHAYQDKGQTTQWCCLIHGHNININNVVNIIFWIFIIGGSWDWVWRLT